MLQRTIGEAQKELETLVRAALNGEEVVIVDNEQQRIRLTPLQSERHPRKAGSARGLIWMADDFDAPLDDFSDYL